MFSAKNKFNLYYITQIKINYFNSNVNNMSYNNA